MLKNHEKPHGSSFPWQGFGLVQINLIEISINLIAWARLPPAAGGAAAAAGAGGAAAAAADAAGASTLLLRRWRRQCIAA